MKVATAVHIIWAHSFVAATKNKSNYIWHIEVHYLLLEFSPQTTSCLVWVATCGAMTKTVRPPDQTKSAQLSEEGKRGSCAAAAAAAVDKRRMRSAMQPTNNLQSGAALGKIFTRAGRHRQHGNGTYGMGAVQSCVSNEEKI